MSGNGLRDKVEMEIQHHISPLIGWLRMDAAKGKVDTDETRYNQWKDRVGRAVDAIMEHIGEVEYEYAVQRSIKATGFLAPIPEHMWTNKESAERAIEFNQIMFPDKIVDYPEWLVKRRKAGKVEDA